MLKMGSTQLIEPLPLSANVICNVAVGISGIDSNKTVKKSSLHTRSIVEAMSYLTPAAKAAFIQLKKLFTRAFILSYFDLKYYIWIKIIVSGYTISGVLSQFLT